MRFRHLIVFVPVFALALPSWADDPRPRLTVVTSEKISLDDGAADLPAGTFNSGEHGTQITRFLQGNTCIAKVGEWLAHLAVPNEYRRECPAASPFRTEAIVHASSRSILVGKERSGHQRRSLLPGSHVDSIEVSGTCRTRTGRSFVSIFRAPADRDRICGTGKHPSDQAQVDAVMTASLRAGYDAHKESQKLAAEKEKKTRVEKERDARQVRESENRKRAVDIQRSLGKVGESDPEGADLAITRDAKPFPPPATEKPTEKPLSEPAKAVDGAI